MIVHREGENKILDTIIITRERLSICQKICPALVLLKRPHGCPYSKEVSAYYNES